MAVRALPPGAVRRRAMFGLLDADGWTWAFLKALFWFLLVIFLLGYLPDRAYYFTVSKTIDLGFNAVPLVNLCPATNEDLPCPAPKGAMIPWQTSPDELALPEARVGGTTFQSGETLYLIGGEVDGAATADVLSTTVTDTGNFDRWSADAPALPEPRAGAAVISLSGTPYVIGGRDASGAPTTTVFRGVIEGGALTAWEAADDLALPAPLSDAMGAAASTGIYLMGGRTADGIVATTWHASLDDGDPPALEAWEDLQLPLPEPRAGAGAVSLGDNVYLLGGEGPDGVTASVYRLTLDEGELVENEDGTVNGWATAPAAEQLPEPRIRAAAFAGSGVIYVIGGADASGTPQSSVLWTSPDAVGDLPPWGRIADTTDLPEARAGSAVQNVGAFAFLVGGEGPDGPVAGSMRADLSPQTPFFRLGMFGATVPGLAIEGEIGQQLGYINAAGMGTTNFVVLILIGIAYSHQQGTMRFIERLSRGRIRAPREEQYPVRTER